MFTGIIEETGTIASITISGHCARLRISCKKVLEQTNIGDSIAVNGICLTAVSLSETEFAADVMEETLRRSSLGVLHAGDAVNLERAMAADGRFGGHLVLGHIDGVGTIRSLKPKENAVWVTVAAGPELLRYIVEKGSVALDGISLTVVCVTECEFQVSVIPHTIGHTALRHKEPGSPVNIECDVIGKYVEKLLTPAQREQRPQSRITEEFLKKYGF